MTEYIERDVAIELLSQPITMSMCLSVAECHHKIAQQSIDRYLIENIPAADVRPVVRGKWVYEHDYYGSRYRCSSCGYTIHPVDESGARYCPNCGAKMEES